MIRKAVYGVVYVADDLFRIAGFVFIQGHDQPLFTEEFIGSVDCFRNAVRVDKETVSGMQREFTVFVFGFFVCFFMSNSILLNDIYQFVCLIIAQLASYSF